MRMFLAISLFTVAAVLSFAFMGCTPADDGAQPTAVPPTASPTTASTPAPTAPSMGAGVIFDSGFFNPILVNPKIWDSPAHVAELTIQGNAIVVPAGADAEIRFNAIDASAYTSVVFTAVETDGGTVSLFSYDVADAYIGQIEHSTGFDQQFISNPTTINFIELDTPYWDPDVVGFQKQLLDGFGVNLVTATAKTITKIELQ